MIEVLTANTPNGKKITIMLEEIQFDYKITKININKDEQFSKEFKKISPFSKIPVIIDHGNNESIFESGAPDSKILSLLPWSIITGILLNGLIFLNSLLNCSSLFIFIFVIL